MVFIGLVGEHVCEGAPWWTDVLVNCLDLWADVRRPSPLWSAPFSRKVIIGCIRKLAQHEPESDPASSFYSGFPQIPAWIPVRFPSMMVATWKGNANSSLLQVFCLFVCLFGQSVLSQQHNDSRTTTMHRCFAEKILLIYLILPVTNLYLSDLFIFFKAYFNLIKFEALCCLVCMLRMEVISVYSQGHHIESLLLIFIKFCAC